MIVNAAEFLFILNKLDKLFQLLPTLCDRHQRSVQRLQGSELWKRFALTASEPWIIAKWAAYWVCTCTTVSAPQARMQIFDWYKLIKHHPNRGLCKSRQNRFTTICPQALPHWMLLFNGLPLCCMDREARLWPRKLCTHAGSDHKQHAKSSIPFYRWSYDKLLISVGSAHL